MGFCAAFGCSNSSDPKKKCKEKGISFHAFPIKNPEMLKLWITKIRREGFKPTQHSLLCSEHFEEESFTYQNFTGRRQLKQGAVPTKFSLITPQNKRQRTSYEMGASVAVEDDSQEPATKDQESQASLVDIDTLQGKIKSQEDIISTLQHKLSKHEFRLNNLEEKEIKILTGFSLKTFLTIFQFLCLTDALKNMKCKLDPINQFFLFMTRIRQGLSEAVLGIMFKVDQSTVNRTFTKCLGAIHCKVKILNIWPPKHQIKAYMPLYFQRNFPACRVIIDCTEFFWQQTKNPYNHQCSFSNYKNHNTLKSLIGMAPNGSINLFLICILGVYLI